MEAVEYFKQGYSCSESIIMYCIDKGKKASFST